MDIRGENDILKKIINHKFPLNRELNIAGKDTNCLEITKSGIHKGFALSKLSRYLNINLNDIIVFGNEDNDIPMFEVAGWSIAMGNSPKEVKEKAKSIAPDDYEEGVLWGIRKILQYKWEA